jgi:hypothetical protein
MSFGIAAYGDDNKIAFHSDYSSVVYAGEMTKTTAPVRPVFLGTSHNSISASQKSSNYDMGWIVQYSIDLDVDYMLPFYKPYFNGQEVGIMDMVNEGSTWVVNLIYWDTYNGAGSMTPRVFAFAPIAELPSSSVTLNDYGIAVYDASGDIVFTDSKKPLRIDDVVTMTPPSSIRTASKGYCGANGQTCHVNFTSDQTSTTYGNGYASHESLYHIIPSAYGGLAFNSSGTGSQNCGWLGIGTQHYAWNYRSWSSFRGTVKTIFSTQFSNRHEAGWLSEYGGAGYQIGYGGCGLGGFLGALLGVLLAVATGGISLALIGGALAGFAVGSISVGTTPTLKAYQNDANFDTNPVKMLITRTSYYGIT